MERTQQKYYTQWKTQYGTCWFLPGHENSVVSIKALRRSRDLNNTLPPVTLPTLKCCFFQDAKTKHLYTYRLVLPFCCSVPVCKLNSLSFGLARFARRYLVVHRIQCHYHQPPSSLSNAPIWAPVHPAVTRRACPVSLL